MSTSAAPPLSRKPSWSARIGWTLVTLLSIAIAVFSARYLLDPPQTQAQAIGNPFGVPWLVIHVAGSVTALAIGSIQFVPALRRGARRPHRWTGRVYVLGCLVGGVAGLILATGSSAGPIASVGFGLLAVAWLSTTLLGWRAAVQGRLVEHRRWMIRSWALTLAAVTLRIYLPMVMILDLPFVPWYRAISFLAWAPNLILAELWLMRRARSGA